MEMLFVVLVIALIVSFAVPALRNVRYDIYNARAKTALKKLAEAQRSFYQLSKGSAVSGIFQGSSAKSMANSQCHNIPSSGIPGQYLNAGPEQLFACGYLDWRDFDGLPYAFHVCPFSGNVSGMNCQITVNGRRIYSSAIGVGNNAGKKYTSGNYMMYIGSDMEVQDTAE